MRSIAAGALIVSIIRPPGFTGRLATPSSTTTAPAMSTIRSAPLPSCGPSPSRPSTGLTTPPATRLVVLGPRPRWRGDPRSRSRRTCFHLPEMTNSEYVAEGWYPKFLDYLNLSFKHGVSFQPARSHRVRTEERAAVAASECDTQTSQPRTCAEPAREVVIVSETFELESRGEPEPMLRAAFPAFYRTQDVELLIDDGTGKPETHLDADRQALSAGGNADGDVPMLETVPVRRRRRKGDRRDGRARLDRCDHGGRLHCRVRSRRPPRRATVSPHR